MGFRKVSFLRQKSEAYDEFKKFEAVISRQTGNNIKILRSDNGKEFVCQKFAKFLEEKGIIHEISAPYIHEQNGHAEREIQTLVNSARSIIIAKNVPRDLWPEAINATAYILNRVLLKHNENETPYEKWFKKKPQVKHLRIFGSVAYLNIPKKGKINFLQKVKDYLKIMIVKKVKMKQKI